MNNESSHAPPELPELLLLDEDDEEDELDELLEPEELPDPLLDPPSSPPLLDEASPEVLELVLLEDELGRASRPASRAPELASVRMAASPSSSSSDSNSVPVAHAVAAVPIRTKQKVRPRSRRCIVGFAVARVRPRGKEHRSQFAQMLRERGVPASACEPRRISAPRERKRRAEIVIECYPAGMDELSEKGAGNLPLQSPPCWNESMHPSKAELSTGSPSGSRATRSGTGEGRRTERDPEHELGLAMTDALADILRTERDPRQRRAVS